MGKRESIDVRAIIAGLCFFLFSVINVVSLLCHPRNYCYYYSPSYNQEQSIVICLCLIIGTLIILGKKRVVGIAFVVLALKVVWSWSSVLSLLFRYSSVYLFEIVTYILLAIFHLTSKTKRLVRCIWWIPVAVFAYTLITLTWPRLSYPEGLFESKILRCVHFLCVLFDCIWIRGNIPFIKKKVEEAIAMDGAVYSVKGVRGRYLYVFDNKVIIHTKMNWGSLLTGNATDGEKTIYYVDCIGVQFKRSDATIGYLQLETASGMMNNKDSNFFNENTFTFDGNNIIMHEIATYVKARIEEVKTHKNQPAIQEISKADEIKKFKELLDEGIINQEEFDAKKKELLGL